MKLEGGCYCGAVRYLHPEDIDVVTCTLDDPEAVPPRNHTWTREKLGWLRLYDGLPRFLEARPEAVRR